MTYTVHITDLTTVNALPDYWSEADLRALLEAYGMDEVAEIPTAELREYLALAMRELDPAEAAAVVLTYKLSDALTEGQIEQISHDMLEDKIVEEYPEIALHERLWHVNQLLYKGFNGKFPNTEASVITATITPKKDGGAPLDEAAALQVLGAGLIEHAVMPRLLEAQLKGTEAFPTAEHILWELETTGEHTYRLVTSDYWLSEEDFGSYEFEGEARPFVEEDED